MQKKKSKNKNGYQSYTFEDIQRIKKVACKVQSDKSKKLQKDIQPFLYQAYINTIDYVYDYIDPDLVEYLFPGMEVDKIESYDFNKANIEIYILTSEDNVVFNNKSGMDEDVLCTAFTKRDFKEYTNEDNPVLIFSTQILKHWEELSSEDQKILMEMNIVSTFVHEILHILGLNTSSIPFAVTEGFVELIAQTIMKQDPYFIKHSKLFRYAFLAYPDITLGMNLLVNKLYTNGIDMDVLIMAFGMGDRNSLSLIIDKMVEVYGGEVTDEILRVTAEDPYSFGEYMESLEKEK